ncbi:MAG: hypothetical protein WDA65_09040 [Christensenellales bacterium]
MKKVLVIVMLITLFLAACTVQNVKPTVPTATDIATAAPISPIIQESSSLPEPTVVLPASSAPETAITQTPTPTPAPKPTPAKDLSAIKGMWYNIGDASLSIEFYTNGKADFHGSAAECTGYEFDTGAMKGTIWLDDGGGPFPYDLSIKSGNLKMLGDIYSRSPIVGMWYNAGDASLSIEFRTNGTADFHGSAAECTGYKFDKSTMKGTIWLDDGGGPFPYDISITSGSLHMLGDVYKR